MKVMPCPKNSPQTTNNLPKMPKKLRAKDPTFPLKKASNKKKMNKIRQKTCQKYPLLDWMFQASNLNLHKRKRIRFQKN